MICVYIYIYNQLIKYYKTIMNKPLKEYKACTIKHDNLQSLQEDLWKAAPQISFSLFHGFLATSLRAHSIIKQRCKRTVTFIQQTHHNTSICHVFYQSFIVNIYSIYTYTSGHTIQISMTPPFLLCICNANPPGKPTEMPARSRLRRVGKGVNFPS